MKKELIAYRNPKSPTSEMFRTLRTNIQFMNSSKELKTLLVTSTLPEEGKSFVSANLAVTFAQADKRVLLVDADMRKGRQFNIFDISPTPGLSNYLSGIIDGETDTNCGLERFVQKTEIDNLFVITAGDVPPNPAELLVSEKMLNLMKSLKEVFDIIIFDGAPSLLLTDSPILSRIVDSTIIVTAHNDTKIDNVEKVKKAIENIGGEVAGVVINKIPVSNKKYENSYYYGNTTTLGKKKKAKNRQVLSNSNINYNRAPRPTNSNNFQRPTKNNYTKPNTEEYNKIEKNYDSKPTTEESHNPELTVDKTQDILNQIQNYLNTEKGKLKNGDNND